MDAAFKTGAYPGYTTTQLQAFIAVGKTNGTSRVIVDKMIAELARRKAVAAGDVSQMTPGERLRAARRSNR